MAERGDAASSPSFGRPFGLDGEERWTDAAAGVAVREVAQLSRQTAECTHSHGPETAQIVSLTAAASASDGQRTVFGLSARTSSRRRHRPLCTRRRRSAHNGWRCSLWCTRGGWIAPSVAFDTLMIIRIKSPSSPERAVATVFNILQHCRRVATSSSVAFDRGRRTPLAGAAGHDLQLAASPGTIVGRSQSRFIVQSQHRERRQDSAGTSEGNNNSASSTETRRHKKQAARMKGGTRRDRDDSSEASTRKCRLQFELDRSRTRQTAPIHFQTAAAEGLGSRARLIMIPKLRARDRSRAYAT